MLIFTLTECELLHKWLVFCFTEAKSISAPGSSPVTRGNDQCLNFSLLLFFQLYIPFSRKCELSHPAHTTCLWLSLCQNAELYEYRTAPLWQDKLCRKLRTPPSVFATVIMCDQIFMLLSPSRLLSDIYRSIYHNTHIVIIIFIKHITACAALGDNGHKI